MPRLLMARLEGGGATEMLQDTLPSLDVYFHPFALFCLLTEENEMIEVITILEDEKGKSVLFFIFYFLF